MTKKSLLSVSLLINMLTLPAIVFAYPQGPYWLMTGGYARNWAANNTSIITLRQVPGGSINTLQNSNDSHVSNVMVGMSAGYTFGLTSHWSLSLGPSLIKYQFEQNGQANLVGTPVNYFYNYRIDALALDGTARLNYNVGSWQYFLSVDAGLAWVKAHDYQMNNQSQTDNYRDKTRVHFVYGGEIGIMRIFNASTSLGISMGYQQLGTAQLGAREMLSPATSSGHIEQALKIFSIQFNLIHWF